MSDKRELSNEAKESIDNMSYFDMLNKWRFAPMGAFSKDDPYSDYFIQVLAEKKAADPAGAVAASKALSN